MTAVMRLMYNRLVEQGIGIDSVDFGRNIKSRWPTASMSMNIQNKSLKRHVEADHPPLLQSYGRSPTSLPGSRSLSSSLSSQPMT